MENFINQKNILYPNLNKTFDNNQGNRNNAQIPERINHLNSPKGRDILRRRLCSLVKELFSTSTQTPNKLDLIALIQLLRRFIRA